MDARIVAFDLETTGLSPETDRIVEFCFITLDDDLQEVERWTERVNPGIPIPPEVVEVHHITDADVADCPPFDAFASRIQGMLQDTILVAYNHGFDMNVLHYELVRHGQPGLKMDHPVIDPLVIFRQHHPHSLAGAVRHYLDRDLTDAEAHSAEGDTAAMVDVLRAQIQAHALPGKASENLLERRRRFLDRAKRFYEDEDGVPRFGFGKYRDAPVADHIDYVQWMLAKDFAEDTKNVAAKLVDQAMQSRQATPPATPASGQSTL